MSRSSPVFAILAVIFPVRLLGLLPAGDYPIPDHWLGDVARSSARCVIAFDRQMEIQRNKLIEEFHVQVSQKPDLVTNCPRACDP